MFFDDYQKKVLEQLEKLQANRPVIDLAAHAIVEAMQSGHYVFCSAIGHGMQGDFYNRAGGLGNVRLFTWELNLNNAMPTALDGPSNGSVRTMTFESGATVNIDLGSRKLANGDKIVSWSAIPEGITFVDPSKRWWLDAREDGIYAARGFKLVIR